jgi:glycosyltransferase involved in cell wall biosynthesis
LESITIVIPAFNEATTISAVIDEVHAALEGYDGKYEIVVVDDGSTDATGEAVEKIADERVRLLRHETNRGAGQALKTGLAAAQCDLAVFVPADGQFDPRDVPKFAEAATDADIVLGCRCHRDPYGLVRRIQSKVYLGLVNFLFNQRYSDVNWVQMWRVKTAGAIKLDSTGVFMQQELIDRARRAGMRIVEAPASFRQRAGGLAKGSTTGTVITTIREMLKYRFSR